MKELSMHVYDLMENSTAANSTLVELTIRDSLKDNIYAFTIKDNGKGMTPEFWPKSPTLGPPRAPRVRSVWAFL